MAGRTPKLLLPIPCASGSETILRATVRNALATRLERVHLVVGHEADAHLAALGELVSDPRLRVHRNPLWPEGRSASIRLGFEEAVAAGAEALCFLCADQPRVSPAVITRVLDAFERSGAPLAFPLRTDGQKGNPLVCRADLREEFEAAAEGDSGALGFVKSHWDEAAKSPLSGPETVAQRDVDDAADYAALVAEVAESCAVPAETSPAPPRWGPPPMESEEGAGEGPPPEEPREPAESGDPLPKLAPEPARKLS